MPSPTEASHESRIHSALFPFACAMSKSASSTSGTTATSRSRRYNFHVADVMTAAQRSRCMSRIRGSDTKPEMIVRRALWRRGLRFRTKTRLPGRPDIVFPTERIAVFVDGCFWHCCPQHQVQPSTNAVFWQNKLSGNVERDRRTKRLLAAEGWIVLRFWEHDVDLRVETVVRRIHRRVLKRRATLKTRKAGGDRRSARKRPAVKMAGR